MKKIMALMALIFVFSAAGAFADHPSGWGLGLIGGYNGGWSGGGASPGVGLSLKAPSLPIFWGIHLGLSNHAFNLGVTGDYYIVDQKLVPEANLHWFLGVGGWFKFYNHSDDGRIGTEKWNYSYTSLGFGARVPVGLSWQPVDFFELFLDIAPSLGVAIDTEGTYTVGGQKYVGHDGGIVFPAGGWGLDLGLRFWL